MSSRPTAVRRLLIFALALQPLLPARTAWADADATFRAGQAALQEGRLQEALRKADDGYAEKKQARFVLLKALALEKLGRIAEAWQLIQLVLPRDIPTALHGEFAAAYERLEKAAAEEPSRKAAAEKADQAQKDALAKLAAAEAKRREADQRRSSVLWISAGCLVGAGAAATGWGWFTADSATSLKLVDPATHADYRSRMSLGRTLYWSGVGAMGAGLLVGTWAYLDGRSEPAKDTGRAEAWHLQPILSPDEAGVQLTGGF